MFRYLLLFMILLSSTMCFSADPTQVSNGNNGKGLALLLADTTMPEVTLRINIPKHQVTKQSDFNSRSYRWLTTTVFADLPQKAEPLKSFISDSLKYYTSQTDCPAKKELLATGQRLEKQYAENPDFLMWLGFICMVNSEKPTARVHLNKAFKMISNDKNIPASRKFICGLLLTYANHYKRFKLRKTAETAMLFLVDAINSKEVTAAESDIILRSLYKKYSSCRLIDLFLKHTNKITQADPWLINTCRGYSEVTKAWKARSSRWARDVTKTGWQGFYQHLKLAEEYLNSAWNSNPERPEAPTKMITVIMGKGRSRDQLDVLWFNRAVSAQADYLSAYYSLLWARNPRWGGSYKQMLQIGNAALNTKLYDNGVPLIYFYTLDSIVAEMPCNLWRTQFRTPGVYERLEAITSKMLTYPLTPDETQRILSYQFWIRRNCGKYSLAAQSLKKIGSPVSIPTESNIMLTNNYTPIEQKLFNGPYKAELIKAENLTLAGQYNDGVKIFMAIIAQLKNPLEKAYLIKRIARVYDERITAKAYHSYYGLHIAAYNNNAPLVKLIAGTLGVNINQTDKRGRNALHIAMRKPSDDKSLTDTVELLIDYGIDINLRDNYERQPFSYYIMNTKRISSKILDLFKGINVNTASKTGWTLLHYALSHKKDNVAKWLIDKGADINAKTKDGWTILHYAVTYKQPDLAATIIAKGGNIDAVTQNGWSVLSLALKKRQLTVAEKIISLGAKLNFQKKSNGWAALHYAAANGDTEITELLIKKGAKVSIAGKGNQAPIHIAAHKGNYKIVELLLANGVDVNGRGGNSLTPLDYAIHCSSPTRRLQTVKLIVKYQADINKCDFSGWSPVYRCSRFNMPQVLSFLLKRGAKVNIKDNSGRTALDMAKNDEIKKILLKYGAKYAKELP